MGTATNNYDRHIYMGTDGKIKFGWNPGTVVVISSTGTLNNGAWHHAVGTHDSYTNTGKLYIDGVLQATGTGAAENYTGYWRVGSYKLAGWSFGVDGYFPGSIDETSIYNRALSATEVTALFNSAGTAPTPTPTPAPSSCTLPWGGTIASGSSVTAYSASSVACGYTCSAPITRTCTNGVLSGSTNYAYSSCTVSACSNCTTPWGASVTNGQSVQAYSTGSVACAAGTSGTCPSPTTRTCNNGVLSGTGNYASCTVSACAACTLPWGGTLSHGQSVQAYSVGTISCGGLTSTCPSPTTRTCSNGTLSGTGNFSSCTATACATCSLPWGGTLSHGQSVQAYSSSSAACGSTCAAPITRTCTNGVLSGSGNYTYSSCTATACATCAIPWGGTLSHGQSIQVYAADLVQCGSTCSTPTTRTCNNGVLSGTGNYARCAVSACVTCALPWGGTISHGASVTAYAASTVACGSTCAPQTRTCNNGTLSGTNTNRACTVSPCPVNGACGSAQGQTFSTKPIANLCSAGAASVVSQTTANRTWTWTCIGANAGTTANCSALMPAPINGACGSAQGQLFTTVPTTNLCSSGTATAVSLTLGQWKWSCGGLNTGTAASCTALSDVTSPSTPTSVTARATSATNVTVSWIAATDNIRVTGYKIYKNNIQVGTSVTTSYTATGLTALTAYSFSVSSYDAAGNESTRSPAVSATTLNYTLIGSIIATPSYGVGSLSNVILTATATGTAPGSINYTFYCNRSDTGKNITTPYSAKFDNQTATKYVTSPLCNYSSAGKYYAKVIIERGPLSIEKRVLITVKDNIAPSVPTGLSAWNYTTATRAYLIWNPSTDNVGVMGYRIYRNGVLLATTKTNSYLVYTSTIPYSYTVTAYDASGNSSAQSAAVTTNNLSADTTPPSTPGNLTATATAPNKVSLAWGLSTDNSKVAGYKIYRNDVKISATSGTTFINLNLIPGTTYVYSVEAYDISGNVSARTAGVSVTTPLDTVAPTTPRSLRLVPRSATQVGVYWYASTDNVKVTGYNIYKNGIKVGTSLGTSFQNITGLYASTTYSYTVSAYDASGNTSPQTAPVSVTTLP